MRDFAVRLTRKMTSTSLVREAARLQLWWWWRLRRRWVGSHWLVWLLAYCFERANERRKWETCPSFSGEPNRKETRKFHTQLDMQQILQNKCTKNTKQTKSEQKEHHNVHKKIKTNRFTERKTKTDKFTHGICSLNFTIKYMRMREFEAFSASERERERESGFYTKRE